MALRARPALSINRELKRLKTQIAQLEERKSNPIGGSGL
jgi:hypothetical protein